MARPIVIPNVFQNQTGNIPLSQLDTDFSTIATAVNDPASYANYAVDSGAINAYIITLNPAPSSLASMVGVTITFKPLVTNTGASTINVNGFGAINIVNSDSSALIAGEIVAGNIFQLSYNGTNFILMSVTTNLANLANVTGVLTESHGGTGTTTGYYGFKNRIINGAMVIDQRNAGASVTPNNTYTLDRWLGQNSQTSKYTVQQSSTAPSGFKTSLLVTSSSAYSVGSGDYFFLNQPIEGFNTADLGFGAAGASTITISFWVRSSLTGTFGGSIRNYTIDRSYPFSYTISSANTWEQKSVTIAGDTSGTWVGATNSVGMYVAFGLGTGSSLSGTAGAWATANYVQPTGTVSVVGTSGATFYITGVQLEKGSTATSFDYRPYGTELALCQRYYFKTIFNGGYVATLQAFSATSAFGVLCYPPVPMRAAPSTITTSTIGNFRLYDATANPAAVTTTFNVAMSTGPLYCTQVSRTGSGLVAGTAVVIDVSTTSYVDASAEL
jgi:hypothetical protein